MYPPLRSGNLDLSLMWVSRSATASTTSRHPSPAASAKAPLPLSRHLSHLLFLVADSPSPHHRHHHQPWNPSPPYLITKRLQIHLPSCPASRCLPRLLHPFLPPLLCSFPSIPRLRPPSPSPHRVRTNRGHHARVPALPHSFCEGLGMQQNGLRVRLYYVLSVSSGARGGPHRV